MASSLTQQIFLAALAAGNQPAKKIDDDFQQIILSLNTLATFSNWYVDSGAANAYVITIPAPQVVTLVAGVPFNVKCGAANTGASTLSVVAGSTPLPLQNIVNQNGAALIAGQIQAGGVHAFIYDGSNIQILTPAVSALSSGWMKVGNAISYSYFSTAGNTSTQNLFNLPASGVITALKIKHSTAFSGGTVSACTISVGIAGMVDKYASAFDVFQGVQNYAYAMSGGVFSENTATSTQVTITATSTGDTLNHLTAGVVDVWALISVAN